MNNLNSLSNNNSSNGGKKGTLLPKGKFTNLAGIIIGVVAFIIILIVLHKMRQAYRANKLPGKTEKVLQKYMFDCMNNQKIIDNDLMPAPVVGNQYNLTFWFYINDLEFNYAGNKNIMVKGDIIKHLEDTSKPPVTVNPRIYIPAYSNSLMFEFEVDHFLDEQEGCYPLEPKFFAEAPAEVDMDCYQTHSDKDYYALTAPLQDAEDSTIRGLCTGLISSQLDGLDKTESEKDCLPNLDKLLQKKVLPYFTPEMKKFTTFRDDTHLTDELKTELNTLKGTSDEEIKTQTTDLHDTIVKVKTTAGDINTKLDDIETDLGTLKGDMSKSNVDKIKPKVKTLFDVYVNIKPDAKKLKVLMSLSNITKLKTLITTYNKDAAVAGSSLLTKTELDNLTEEKLNPIATNLDSLNDLIIETRKLYGTLQSFENDMMQHNPNYGNADHMYVKRTSMPAEEKAEIKNVPIQRWNHVSINVHNNITDIFFNGQLELSTEHKGSIKPNTFPLILGAIDSKGESGFNRYVCDLVYTNHVLSEADILGAGTVYSKGPSIVKSTGDSIKSIFS